MQTTSIEQQNVYTVSRLNNEVKFLLEDNFPALWVEGEISNFAAPHSGHWYFSLKDATAQVRCALFRGNQRSLNFTPKDGLQVLIRARVSLYPNRGEYQLIAEHIEERGEGKLRRDYELLKKKLAAAGLFDSSHKKLLPLFPKQIGVITSATGAAIRDILTVLKRRFTCASVIIYPTLVQGSSAAATIVKALQTANQRNECDVLIVARGGGSLEDLWPFNEEIVARAIYESQIPIISGVGHEVDFTIADFVADQRAATPSAAAEICTPDDNELLQMLIHHQKRIQQQFKQKLSATQQQINWMQKHLLQLHPKRQLNEKMQRLDFCELALIQLQTQFIHKLENKLKDLSGKLYRFIPQPTIQQLRIKMDLYQQRLTTLITVQFATKHAVLANFASKLDALSPLNTLERGYAIVSKNNRVIRDVKDVKQDDELHVKLIHGSIVCLVKEVKV